MSEDQFVFNVTLTNFDKLVLERSQSVPVIVDFWAAWCAPCQILMPMLARLAHEYQGKFVLAKVNTDQERELAQNYGIRNLPTVKIFRHGKVVEEFMGAQPESVVRTHIERHIEKKAEQLRQQAALAHEQGKINQALALLNRAVELEPANKNIKLDLVRMLIATEELHQAQLILSTLPTDEKEITALLNYFEIINSAANDNAAELAANLVADLTNHDLRYRLAALQLKAKQYTAAMDNLIEIVRRDRKFRDDGARKALLTIFEFLGMDNDLAILYRKRLINLLH